MDDLYRLLNTLKFTPRQWRVFRRIQRKKYPVSNEHLLANRDKIERFLWYAMQTRAVIKRRAVRMRPNQRIVLKYYHFRMIVFDPNARRDIKKRKRNVKQWSKRLVDWLRNKYGAVQYDELLYDDGRVEKTIIKEPDAAEISQRLKEQLEFLNSGKRTVPLIEAPAEAVKTEKHTARPKPADLPPSVCIAIPREVIKGTDILRKPSTSVSTKVEKTNFLDMLINKSKVNTRNSGTATSVSEKVPTSPIRENHGKDNKIEHSTDSSDEFFGFDVPSQQNSAFVSESLNKFMRDNLLEKVSNQNDSENFPQKHRQASVDGLLTPSCSPPPLLMPVVPESLQKLRTVAERRSYLQKFSKNSKMTIVNNEATIYRELQRKLRSAKPKSGSQPMQQAFNSQMPFTRIGWQAAAFVATESNKYYYQKLEVDNRREVVKLRGVRGNNEDGYKQPYSSYVPSSLASKCSTNCVDKLNSEDFREIRKPSHKLMLNNNPLASVYRPCPLSFKAMQKPLDDEAPILLDKGNSMKIVRMPEILFEVCTAVGKPLSEVAKRYLNLILPDKKITRTFAEFAASTVLQPHKKQVDTVKSSSKWYTFTIPYINDRSHLLVRRVIQRDEQLDPAFDRARKNPRALLEDLSFRANLDQNNTLQMECANVLSEMINSVAIACSENSFTQEDPDVSIENNKTNSNHANNSAKAPGRDAKTTPGTANKKQTRLFAELKRLNATIIDAAALSENDSLKSCNKESCTLGCVCPTALEYSLRPHCGKVDCMLECHCKPTKGSHPSQIMRLDADGRSITTEDAFMLRRKVTARLARMEKEFTSTIVLTDKETLLINDSQVDKRRRCTKAPKRYDDFGDDEDFTRTSPIKLDSSNAESSLEVREPVYVEGSVLDQLKHCTVPLTRFSDIENIAPWCMVHELYKCFCGGTALDGKPMIIEREPVHTTTVEHQATKLKETSEPKARYSFETRPEIEASVTPAEPEVANEPLEDEYGIGGEIVFSDKNNTGFSDVASSVSTEWSRELDEAENRHQISESDIKRDYLIAQRNTCRRAVEVPTYAYLKVNRGRKFQVEHAIKKNEDKRKRLLLNEHILRSVYHYKDNLYKAFNTTAGIKPPRANTFIDGDVICIEDDDSEPENSLNSSHVDDTPSPSTSAASASSGLNSNNSAPKVQEKNINKSVKVVSAKHSTAIASIPAGNKEIDTPLISHMALDDITKDQVTAATAASTGAVNDMSVSDISSVSINAASQSAFEGTMGGLDWNTYNTYVKELNVMVNKKMQDILFALNRKSKVIPEASLDVLCLIKWPILLEAFLSFQVSVWELKMKRSTILAVTKTDMMPIIPGAFAAINILVSKISDLPLLGQMLRNNFQSNGKNDLAVLMQGRQQYWLIRGFLMHDSEVMCRRPTPETNPVLAKKINVFCCLNIKERGQRKQVSSAVMPASATSGTHVDLTAFERTAPTGTTVSPAIQRTTQAVLTPVQGMTTTQQQPQQLPQLQPYTQARCPSRAVVPRPKGPVLPALRLLSTAQSQQENSSLNIMPLLELSEQHELAAIASNLEFRQVTEKDRSEVHPPEFHEDDHRWLVVDLRNDFSHILVPDFRDVVALDRIHKVMAFAREKKKIVKLQFFLDAPFDAFVTPHSTTKIYFGPFMMDVPAPRLVLLQSVERIMMLREMYQKSQNIETSIDERTRAFWLVQRNGRLQLQNNDEEALCPDSGFTSPEQPQPSQQSGNDDSDDDCIIIEPTEIAADGQSSESPVQAEELSVMPPLTKKPTMIQNSQTAFFELNSQLPSTSGAQRINYSIQTTDDMERLQITPSVGDIMQSNTAPLTTNIATGIGSVIPLPASVYVPRPLNLPKNAVITSVAKAPKDAPYGSTIYISKAVPGPLNVGSVRADASNANIITTMQTPPVSTAVNHNAVNAPVRATTAATATIASTEQSSPMAVSIKKPGFSLRCANVADSKATNIALAAARKLIPESELQQNKDSVATEATEQDGTVGNEQIMNAEQAVTDAVGNTAPNARSIQKTDVTPPVVFDVDLDGPDEPAASILVKPPVSTTKNTAVGASNTQSGSNVAQTASKPMSKGNSVKRYASGAFKSSLASIKKVHISVDKPPSRAINLGNESVGQAKIDNAPPTKKLCTDTENPNSQILRNTDSSSDENDMLDELLQMATDATVFEQKSKATPAVSTVNVPAQSAPINSSSSTPAASSQKSHLGSAAIGIKILPSPKTITAVQTVPLLKLTGNNITSTAAPLVVVSSAAEGPTTSTSTTAKSTVVLPKIVSATSLPLKRTASGTPKQPQLVRLVNPGKVMFRGSPIPQLSQPRIISPVNVANVVSQQRIIRIPNASLQSNKTFQTLATNQQRFSLPSTMAMTKTTTKLTNAINVPKTVTVVAAPNVSNVTTAATTACSVSSAQVISVISDSERPTTSGATQNLRRLSVPPVRRSIQSGESTASIMPPAGNAVRVIGPSEDLQDGIQYGYMCTNIAGAPRFVVKRAQNQEFLVKLPQFGIIRLRGLENVGRFLNMHINKQYKLVGKGPVVWKFIPQERLSSDDREKIQRRMLEREQGNPGNVKNPEMLRKESTKYSNVSLKNLLDDQKTTTNLRTGTKIETASLSSKSAIAAAAINIAKKLPAPITVTRTSGGIKIPVTSPSTAIENNTAATSADTTETILIDD